ncbi:MAG: ABC transporter permease [Chloroflexi bacterium]|nr:ABC transporter permease [Chloroflexota bacterium]
MNESVVRLNTSPVQPENPWQLAWRHFRRHRLALSSAGVLAVFVLLALLANVVAPYNPNAIDPRNTSVKRGFPQAPSLEHPLGTDDFNRDLLSRALYGMQVSLAVGFFAMLITIAVGVTVGSLAGYAGGLVDNLFMRLADIFLAIPSFILFLALNALLSASIWNVVFILGLFSWMDVARLVRAEFLSLKERDFVMAARAIGVSPWRMITTHLMPNALAPVIVAATLAVPSAILSESALSFLGLGVPPPDASLGNLLQDAKAWMTSAWWLWVTPGVLISLIVLAFNFVGDGLRDSFDPTLYRR